MFTGNEMFFAAFAAYIIGGFTGAVQEYISRSHEREELKEAERRLKAAYESSIFHKKPQLQTDLATHTSRKAHKER